MKKFISREHEGRWQHTAKVFAVSSSGVFLLVFAWSLIAGLFIQWAVLPALPGLHAGHGLMNGGDWIGFHRNAVELASLMQDQGWQVWKLRPQGNAPIGITAAAYFLAGISDRGLWCRSMPPCLRWLLFPCMEFSHLLPQGAWPLWRRCHLCCLQVQP